ncbi:MAG: hypothetical protein K0U34_01520, partial [Alphaproteobacteria bacterium]|nr:hypothetical protein [Alphaproteobacteria bacterium]
MSEFCVRCLTGTKAMTAAIALLAVSLTPVSAKDQRPSGQLPGRIDAHYSIALAGFDLGHFVFEQRAQGRRYT